MKILPYYIPVIGIFYAIDDFEPLADSISHYIGTAIFQGFSILALAIGIASLTH